MDFLTVETLTGRVLFVLVLLSHERRRIMHVNITAYPMATWAAQQVVDAFPDDAAPRWWHRDRNRMHRDAFKRRLAGMHHRRGPRSAESVAKVHDDDVFANDNPSHPKSSSRAYQRPCGGGPTGRPGVCPVLRLGIWKST